LYNIALRRFYKTAQFLFFQEQQSDKKGRHNFRIMQLHKTKDTPLRRFFKESKGAYYGC